VGSKLLGLGFRIRFNRRQVRQWNARHSVHLRDIAQGLVQAEGPRVTLSPAPGTLVRVPRVVTLQVEPH
jgi:hypothetical protein